MNRIEPVEYSFMPKTWVLPQEHGFFLNYARRAVDRGLKLTFILKPANGAMGHGIRLYRNAESVPANPMGGTPCVVQEYINNPLLIDGFKCDLRVYVLVTSCDPLRVYVYNDGLVRLGTEKYMDPSASNGESVYMHLTNYAVNKRHAGYNRSPNEMVGSKRSFSFLDHYLRDTRHVDPVHIWRSIRELIVKTIAIAAPHLLHSYRMCSRGHVQLGRAFSLEAIPAHGFPESRFVASQEVRRSNLRKTNMRSTGERLAKTSTESASTLASTGSVRSQRARSQSSAKTRGIAHFIPSHFFEILGFDILLDNDLKPWLLEVNRSPSFNGDQELDRRVKHGLLMDTLRLLNIRPSDKEAAEKEQHLTACRRLYTNGSASTNQKLFQSTAMQRRDTLKPNTYRSPSMNRIQAMGVAQRLPNTDVSGLSPYAVEQMIIRLRQQLLLIRQRLALEFFEYHNCGNWNLLFPTEDPVAQQRFARFILKNFAKFHNGKAGELQKEMEVTYLNPITEDEILVRLNELFRRYSGNSSPFDIDQNHFDFWSKDQDNYQTEPDQSSSEESLSSNSEQQMSTTNTREAFNTGSEKADKRKDTMKSVLHTEKTHCISNKTEMSKPTLTTVHSIIGTQGLVQKQKKAAQVLIDCPELVNNDFDPSQLETLSDEAQLITMTCSIPLYHHASSPSDCAKPHMSSPSGSTAGSPSSASLQQDLDACVNLKTYYLCVKRMVRMMQNTTFLQNRNTNSDILRNGKQILEFRRSYPRRFSLPKSVNPVQHFVCDVALKAFHSLLTKVHRLVTRQSQVSMTKSDASKFLRGVRIMRILERAQSRLMKDHATLFASLLIGSTSYQKVLPLTEPVLSLEQQCCREFIRLCLECTLNRYERIVNSAEEHRTTGEKVAQFT